MLWNPKDFSHYCSTKVYHDDYAGPKHTMNYGNDGDMLESPGRNNSGQDAVYYYIKVHIQ
jgi:hypothetical protein